jgi:membrane-associated protein
VEGLVEQLLDDVASVGGDWLLLAAFLLALGETAFLTDLLVPGEVGLVVVGAAGERAGEPLAALVAAAALGATIGDSIGWLIGRYGATRLVERWPWVRRRFGHSLDRAHRYFERRGGFAVFAGRFVGALRAVVSVVAGMNGMPYLRFLAWNAAASVLWTGLVVSAGFHLGRNAEHLVSDVALGVTALVAGGFVAWLVARRLRRRAAPRT